MILDPLTKAPRKIWGACKSLVNSSSGVNLPLTFSVASERLHGDFQQHSPLLAHYAVQELHREDSMVARPIEVKLALDAPLRCWRFAQAYQHRDPLHLGWDDLRDYC